MTTLTVSFWATSTRWLYDYRFVSTVAVWQWLTRARFTSISLALGPHETWHATPHRRTIGQTGEPPGAPESVRLALSADQAALVRAALNRAVRQPYNYLAHWARPWWPTCPSTTDAVGLVYPILRDAQLVPVVRVTTPDVLYVLLTNLLAGGLHCSDA